jgi:hypothetical protein
MYLGLRNFLESSSVVKFPRRKRASDLGGGRFWHPKVEIRAAQEAWTHEAERRKHSNQQRGKLLAIIRRCGFINPIIVEENDKLIAGHSF